MDDFPRLIEHGFPLRETSLASVHEKTVRHGHISSMHLWPARRPLAACRAALIATLLPDPGDARKRAAIFKRLAGTIPDTATSGKEIDGGVLRWGNENGPEVQKFRDEIREAYGGRIPRVLDPFAGGGAIPLEALRLGCDVTAMDINPVAWFVLKCTLEYPQHFAGKLHPLPEIIQPESAPPRFSIGAGQPAGLAAHVRAWGNWVLECSRLDLESYYPTIDGKPTVAYLWARTVRCKNCRATIPLLKTRWLCRTTNKAVVLTMKARPDGSGVDFDVLELEKKQRARYDASGTMNSAGVRCPCCPAQMTMAELGTEGKADRMGTTMTAVVTEGTRGKDFRLPTDLERERATAAAGALNDVFADIPFGLPMEPTPKGGSGASRAFSVDGFGLDRWDKLFTARQLLALGTIVKYTRGVRDRMREQQYGDDWIEAVTMYLAASLDRLLDFANCGVQLKIDVATINHSFVRFALSISWDFAEGNPLGTGAGSYLLCFERIVTALDSFQSIQLNEAPIIRKESAIAASGMDGTIDLVLTDPPYYDAIPYSDLMDFFYVWLRRILVGLDADIDAAFSTTLSPKWEPENDDGELIDDASRFGGSKAKSKQSYEMGMYRAFEAARRALRPTGRMVVVFAHKDPNAWETLAAAMIRAGFVVDASWPIATEQAARMRAQSSAALASSIWLVCKKRDSNTKPGWDSSVREEMRINVAQRLREFWDAGIRGPDFVWSAIGPALEAFSKYPRVRKVESPDESMSVSDFLADVRREVVGFAAARVLQRSEDFESGIDGPTTYYLLHRNDFGLASVPVGASILYAVSCNLRDTALIDEYDLLSQPGRLARKNGSSPASDDDSDLEDSEHGEEAEVRSTKTDKSLVQLKQWNDRKRPSLGEDSIGRPAPLIDQIHNLMRLWKLGDVSKVNEYITARGLRYDNRAREVIQAIIELAERATEERSILEAISNHLGDARSAPEAIPVLFT